MGRLLFIQISVVFWIALQGVQSKNRTQIESQTTQQSEFQLLECQQQLEDFLQTCNEQQMPISGEFNATAQTISPCCWDGDCCYRLNSILSCLNDCTLYDQQHIHIIKLVARFGSLCQMSRPLPSCITEQPEVEKYNISDPCPYIAQQLQLVCSQKIVQQPLQYYVRPQDGLQQLCCWPSYCCSLANQYQQYQCAPQNVQSKQSELLGNEEKSSAVLPNLQNLQQQQQQQQQTTFYDYYITGIAELWSEICGLQQSQLVPQTNFAVNSSALYDVQVPPKISSSLNFTSSNAEDSKNKKVNSYGNFNELLVSYSIGSSSNNTFLQNDRPVINKENMDMQNAYDAPAKESEFLHLTDSQGDLESGIDCEDGGSSREFAENQLELYYSVGHTFCLVQTFADLNDIQEADKQICCDIIQKVLMGICQLYRCSQKPCQALDDKSVLNLQFWTVACMYDIQDCDLIQATEFAKQESTTTQFTIVLPQITHSTELTIPPLMDAQQAGLLEVFEALKQIPSLSTVNIAFKSIQQEDSELPSQRPVTIFAPSNKGIESLIYSSLLSSSHHSKILDLIGTQHWNRDLINHVTLQQIQLQNIMVDRELQIQTIGKENLTIKRFREAGDLYVVGCCHPDNYAKIIACSQFLDGTIVMLDKLLYSQQGIFKQISDDPK